MHRPMPKLAVCTAYNMLVPSVYPSNAFLRAGNRQGLFPRIGKAFGLRTDPNAVTIGRHQTKSKAALINRSYRFEVDFIDPDAGQGMHEIVAQGALQPPGDAHDFSPAEFIDRNDRGLPLGQCGVNRIFNQNLVDRPGLETASENIANPAHYRHRHIDHGRSEQGKFATRRMADLKVETGPHHQPRQGKIFDPPFAKRTAITYFHPRRRGKTNALMPSLIQHGRPSPSWNIVVCGSLTKLHPLPMVG